MGSTWLIFPCGLVAGCIYLSTVIPTSFALDRPVQTSGILLLLSGLTFIACAFSPFQNDRRHHRARYHALHLRDLGSAAEHAPHPLQPFGITWRVPLAILLIFAIGARVATFWRVMKDVECAVAYPPGFLPFPLSLYISGSALWKAASSNSPVSLRQVLRNGPVEPTAFLLPSSILFASSWILVNISPALPSTYICPVANGAASLIPKLCLLGFLIDCLVAIILHALSRDGDGSKAKSRLSRRDHILIGLVCISSSLVLAIAGFVVHAIYPEHRQWLVHSPSEYWRSVLLLSTPTPIVILCFLITVRLLGFLRTILIVGFALTYNQAIRTLWTHMPHAFPPKPAVISTFCTCLITAGTMMVLSGDEHRQGRAISLANSRKARMALAILLMIISVAGLFPLQPHLNRHPITVLIETAKHTHDLQVSSAGLIGDLSDAVRVYEKTLSRKPPPNFDKWYTFATDKKSLIINNFSNIEEDMAPYRMLSPAVLRKRTVESLTGNNMLGGISIRAGKASAFNNVPGSHKWMVDATILMLEKFAEHLPDMDIAINLNDECRVAIPYEDSQRRGHISTDNGLLDVQYTRNFSSGRAETWPEILEPSESHSYFGMTGFNPTFQSYGSTACSPLSQARRKRIWNTGTICPSCAAPHSMGVFVKDWAMSADPCHQPDLANLHGLHLSPSSLVGTHSLVPVFSQSKATGYADIRFPSPWNYVDKTRYDTSDDFPDPPFAEKEDTLFWRGGTTEGVSSGDGAWKGMLRQRLVHLANGNKKSPQTVLLALEDGRFEYALKDPVIIKESLAVKTDINFVGEVHHCGGQDCGDQAREFHFREGVDFKQHWRYKYLFDADGAGFSGRFIAFLHSNSLVFKTALFRQWYEGRLIAWHHFVPVDLRLHDIWSSLAYFGGWEEHGGRKWEGTQDDAERIAKQGREWSEKVLRKEDMEIYMFRLLLELGRLTDDNRDQIGFQMDTDSE